MMQFPHCTKCELLGNLLFEPHMNVLTCFYSTIRWLSVLAVLTIKFARTIAMALSIGDFAHKFMNRWIAPVMKKATPKEYSVSQKLLCDHYLAFILILSIPDMICSIRNGCL